jgi:cyclopropane fatty-acyl-phospholipid synthase-like methyltransferase
VLDIGRGYGTLLARANARGAAGVGITVTPEQVRRSRHNGLDVHLLDYRAVPREWDGTFDGVIANGSMEHFVRPDDVADGKADDVYRKLFASVHRLIDPASPVRRFATTTIHVLRPPADPRAVLKPPSSFARGSDDCHWSVLEHGWGGYYPVLGQLRRCAEGCFDLVEEVDGTEDYRLTSEEWLRRVRRALRSPRLVMSGPALAASLRSGTGAIPDAPAGLPVERVVELAVPGPEPADSAAAPDLAVLPAAGLLAAVFGAARLHVGVCRVSA